MNLHIFNTASIIVLTLTVLFISYQVYELSKDVSQIKENQK